MLLAGAFAISLAGAAAAQVDPGAVAGCYGLEIDAWDPVAFADRHPALIRVPTALELRTDRAVTPGIPVSFATGPAPAGSGLRYVRWWPVAGDSLVVVTSVVRISGARLVLAPGADGLAGRVHSFVHPPDPGVVPSSADAPVRGRRVACSM